MKKYIILSDTSCGLERKFREQYDIEYVPSSYSYDDKTMSADIDWETISAKEFYDIMRGGTRIFTSQITAPTFEEYFEKYVQEGYDVLYIGMPAALSNSINSARIAADSIKEKYPEAKVVCVDAYNACYGQGLLCIGAAEQRGKGATIEEAAKWVEENRKYVHQEGSVEKLTYLKQAGRVSAASAFFGGILNIKPIIMSDSVGRNVAVEKVKGREVSFKRCVERFIKQYDPTISNKVFISHADCLEEAEKIKAMIEKALDGKDADIHIGYVVSPIGASVGPGMFGIYFFGDEVTFSAEGK